MSIASSEPPNSSTSPIADFSEAARRMGKARTEVKRAAARINGRRGGRPEGHVLSAETRRKISQTKRRQARMKKTKIEQAGESST